MRALALRALAALSLLAAPPSLARDRLAFGPPSGSGPFDVPITLADAAGTPLGVEGPAGSRIQAIVVTVRFTPASSVTAVTFRRAGLLAGRTPVFETTATGPGTVTWIGVFDEAAGPLPFAQPPSGAGDTVLALAVTLAPGSSATMSFDAPATTLSNQAGTASESVDDGSLALGPPVPLPPDAAAAVPVPASGFFAVAALAFAIGAAGARRVRDP